MKTLVSLWDFVMVVYNIPYLNPVDPLASSLAQPDSYTSGGGRRESGKVLYIELSQRLVPIRVQLYGIT